MEPNRQHDSGHFPRQKTFPLLIVVSIGCAPKGISGASEDRWGEPGPRCYSHTRINGSAPFQVQETAKTLAELRQGLQAITVYAAALALPLSQVVVRIDGLYGNTAPVNEILSWKLGVIGRSKQYAWLDLRRPSKPDSNQPLMPRLPILKAEPFAISTMVLPCHSPQQGLLSVFLSLLIQLVLTSLLLESYAKKPFTSSSTRRCHLTHLPHQMCCRCICTVDRLRRFYLMKIKSKIQTVGYLAQPLVRIAGRSSRSGSGTSV